MGGGACDPASREGLPPARWPPAEQPPCPRQEKGTLGWRGRPAAGAGCQPAGPPLSSLPPGLPAPCGHLPMRGGGGGVAGASLLHPGRPAGRVPPGVRGPAGWWKGRLAPPAIHAPGRRLCRRREKDDPEARRVEGARPAPPPRLCACPEGKPLPADPTRSASCLPPTRLVGKSCGGGEWAVVLGLPGRVVVRKKSPRGAKGLPSRERSPRGQEQKLPEAGLDSFFPMGSAPGGRSLPGRESGPLLLPLASPSSRAPQGGGLESGAHACPPPGSHPQPLSESLPSPVLRPASL